MNIENEDLLEWAEQIPMEDLWTELRRITGLPELKFTYKVIERRGYVTIQFESQDLIDHVGFLKLMFKEIKIANFNSEVKYKLNENDNEDKPIFYYWGTASFRYSHPSGGSNGCTFLLFKYDDRHGWYFEEKHI